MSQPTMTPVVMTTRPELLQQFSKARSIRTVVSVTVEPSLYITVPTAVHQTLDRLIQPLDLNPCTLENFLLISRTILTKRLRDIFEQQHQTKPTDTLHLSRGILVPQPIAELLYHLGEWVHPYTLKTYRLALVTTMAKDRRDSTRPIQHIDRYSQPRISRGDISKTLRSHRHTTRDDRKADVDHRTKDDKNN